MTYLNTIIVTLKDLLSKVKGYEMILVGFFGDGLYHSKDTI